MGEKPDYEIIAVNDGSTDSSPAIVQDYVNHYPQFIRLITTENMGQGHARNVGIDEAQGEYLYFIDSDDYLAPGAMGEMLRTLDGSYDILIFDSIAMNVDGGEINYYRGCSRAENIDLKNFPELLLENPICGGSICRKSIYTDNAIRFPLKGMVRGFPHASQALRFYRQDRIHPKGMAQIFAAPGSVTNNKTQSATLR